MDHEHFFKRIPLYPLIITTVLTFFLFSFLSPPTQAQTESSTSQSIQQLQQKVNDLQGQANTLDKQVTLLNSQISGTQLRIDGIKNAILKLGSEISDLETEINRLEGALNVRSTLVLKRIPESYKRNQVPLVTALFLSSNFSDLVRGIKYITTVQQDDAQLLFQLKATQTNFAQRKDLRESKVKQQQALQSELEQQSHELEVSKKQKTALLDQTRSSEAIYEKLLAQALAESQAVTQALILGTKVGPVKAGDAIGVVGNTGYPGCSTGPHLHYEVRQNNSWINAEGYLSSKSVQDDQNNSTHTIGSGSWDWPLRGNIIVTQRYGRTPYSWRYTYSGGIHTGVDMYSTDNEIIYAPHDGTLYASSQSCGSSSVIKIKYIEHGDGLVSFYLHVR